MPPGQQLAVAVLSGLVLGILTSVGAPAFLSAAVGVASLAVLLVPGRARVVTLLVAAGLGAGAHGARTRDAALSPPLQTWLHRSNLVRAVRHPVVVRGMLASDAAVVDGGVRLVVNVREVEQGVSQSIRGRVLVHVNGAMAATRAGEWRAGRPIEATVALRELRLLRNPGGPSERWQRLHRPADLAGTVKSAALVAVGHGAWWTEAAANVRAHVRASAHRYIGRYDPQSAAIVAAILIGDRAGLDEGVERRLRAAGTYHVIAISGGNVAILTALVLFALRPILRPFRVAALATMAVVIAYGWIVGAEPSVTRAVTAASIYLGASVIGLRPRPVDVLAATACWVALADPLAVVDPAAWLSFGATLAIVVGAGRFVRWATHSSAEGAPERGVPFRGRAWPRNVWLVVLKLFAATFAAELVLAPLSAALFSRVSLLGLVLNFVAIPSMTAVQLAGLGTVMLAGWADSAASVCGRLANLAATWLVESSRAADAAPGLVRRVPPPALSLVAVYYSALGAALWVKRHRLRQAAWLATGACLVCLIGAPGLEWSGPAGGRLRMTVLDVGQGDAIALQFPGGRALLLDTGGNVGGLDLGARVVTPALWALGVRQLDWLVLTHPDIDHIGAAAAIVDDLRPREIWEGVPVPLHPGLLALRRQAHAGAVGWGRVRAGHSLEVGAVMVDVLHPPPPDWERRRVRNEDSVVIRLRLGSVEMLLTGDAGVEFESAFATGPSTAPLRLIKVGHHGSRTSSSAEFVRAYAPQAAFISVGRGNVFGHPAPDVLDRYRTAGAVVFRTDEDGAAVIETDGAMVDIRTMSGRHWVLRHVPGSGRVGE